MYQLLKTSVLTGFAVITYTSASPLFGLGKLICSIFRLYVSLLEEISFRFRAEKQMLNTSTLSRS